MYKVHYLSLNETSHCNNLIDLIKNLCIKINLDFSNIVVNDFLVVYLFVRKNKSPLQ